MSKHKVGFTCGAFDLLHAGHVLMLEEAKSVCETLIVGLQLDPSFDRETKNKPVQKLDERFIQLRGCKFVDVVVTYATEADLINLLKTLPIDVRIVGADYKGKRFTGDDLPIAVHYNKRDHTFSSTELRNRVRQQQSGDK